MLARLLQRRLLPRPLLSCLSTSHLYWRTPRPALSPPLRPRRAYSSAAEAALRESGLPLRNAGPTTAALLAYAAGNWTPPPFVPPGWSTDYKTWTYLLTLFAYSPYFLRLPQIEMLVNIKHAIPGEVRPLMFHPARDALVFQIDVPPDVEGKRPGGAQVHYLDCARFELWTYERTDVSTVDELIILIGAASTPEGVPLVRVPPDPEGEAALKRILDRDETVITLLESAFLGYAPRATVREEELQSADAADQTQREKLADAIRRTQAYLKEAEEELELDAADLEEGKEGGVDPATLREDQRAHAKIKIAVEDAKGKLAEWKRVWTSRYGPWQA
ncbi:hypothetical protein B0H15DRAFT_33079 [Mycena belliarum]|uniref:Uncharacterized protein n=1 Tax=Mycena belliarum TaxID=1033014 RepID=A0AAD6UAG6_9AGAR|nr:hypothetical protein B0H15DRAFT_33079 [Mycena belliae]